MPSYLPLFCLFLLLFTYREVTAQSAPVPARDTSVRTDATRDRYARDLAELERMKEKFRRQQERKLRSEERGGKSTTLWNGEPLTPKSANPAPQSTQTASDSPQPSDLTTKSPDRQSAAEPSRGITFIPNTAYPNGDGYTALDRLVETVRTAGSVVEIRVHTSRELDRRAAQLLSEERATTIRSYLEEAGIAPENFRVVGFGNHESAAGERVEVIKAR